MADTQTSKRERELVLADANADLTRLTYFMDGIRAARIAVGWSVLGMTFLLAVCVVAVGFTELEGVRYWALALQTSIVVITLVVAGLVKAWSELGNVIRDLASDRNECAAEVSALRLYSQHTEFDSH